MKPRALQRFSVGVLAYNLGVILWGAYVRASGSGAGCGSHWPLCNGAVVPRAAAVQTLVEFSHRLSSGLALGLIVALLLWTFRVLPTGHPARRAAGFSTAFVLSEALIGAGIVLLKLVAHDESIARAFSTSAHLINTFLLVASLTLTCWFLSGGQPFRVRELGPLGTLFAVTWAGALLVGMCGAVAALGDTLFPSATLSEGLGRDFSSAAHLFVRLRALHPLLAVLLSGLLWLLATAAKEARPLLRVRMASLFVMGVVLVQILAGVANVLLLAPTAMQLVHLLLADAVWIGLILLTAETASAPRGEPAPGLALV